MKIPRILRLALYRRACRLIESRRPDFVIGRAGDAYLKRWWLIPRNPIFNVYLHEICRSDDDRALHDHPWVNASIILGGMYVEHTIRAGGIHARTLRTAGDIVVRGPRAAHRLEVIPGSPPLTLFITGPRLRTWGFHCPETGWVPWQDFTAAHDHGQVGKGCGE